MLSTGSASNSRSPAAGQHRVRVIVDRLDAGDLRGELRVHRGLLAAARGKQPGRPESGARVGPVMENNSVKQF